jgi:superfamily II DNA or RNA helicase
VQCKLRSRNLTWRECSTFFASAVSFTNGAYSVPWRSLLLARNSCSTLSRTLAELGASRPFDLPIPLSEFRAYAEECLDAHNAGLAHHEEQSPAPIELRDFQREAIALCTKETERAAYIVLPTGCGKSLIMARVAASADHRVLILVPLVVLCDQIMEVLATFAAAPTAAVAVGGGRDRATASDIDSARVVVCVYNSAYKLDFTKFRRILIDEAHFVRAPMIYADLVADSDSIGTESDSSDSAGVGRDGYAAVRAAATLASARLFSATLDAPEGSEKCTRTLREMIDAGYLCDYQLNVPVFDVGATSSDLARFLVRNYRSMLIFCSTRAEGLAFCSAMNEIGPCARYLDCDTPRLERREVLDSFKTGLLAFVVNVRVLSVGFDAPITRGVCFVNMPASKTHIIQVIGRCLRLHPDKRIAQVVLPLVSGAHDEDKRARDFMRVLAQNDARLTQALRARGGGRVSMRRVESADEDTDASSSAADLLYTAVYDSMGAAITDTWSIRFDEMLAYHTEHGRLPALSMTGLGTWINSQRAHRATMDTERKARLEALPWWVWNARDEAWKARFAELVVYFTEHGAFPPALEPSGLGSWINQQRVHRDTMNVTQKEQLDSLPFWTWDPLEEAWNARFSELVLYFTEHGTLPPAIEPTGLGRWVSKQRGRRGTTDTTRKEKLDALPFWSWGPLEEAWNARFAELVVYGTEHGTLPPFIEPNGLGRWVRKQRRRRGTMETKRKERFEALPFWSWSSRTRR